MTLFAKAENTSAFLKMGIMGFAGAGKTYTATITAIGLIHHMQAQNVAQGARPLFFLDTETGSDWVKPRIEAAGIDLFTAKTRAFSDLKAAVVEAEKNASILLVDSISHFWTEICDAYMRMKKRTRLQFEDWAFLKKEWRGFTDLYINSNVHIILCGRAGYEYDYFEDEAGKKQLEKTGIKMKAEGEMGYEPSLLVLMEREMDLETTRVTRIAKVIKDRSTVLDGRQIVNPTFESFLPHIKFLNLGGRQLGVDASRTSEHTIPADVRDNNRVQRKIVLDEIESLLVLHHPGQSAADKKAKVALLRKHWNASWTEMEEVMPLFDLRAGYDALHQELEGTPSRYTPASPPPPPAPQPQAAAEPPAPSAPPSRQRPETQSGAGEAGDGLDIPPGLKRSTKTNSDPRALPPPADDREAFRSAVDAALKTFGETDGDAALEWWVTKVEPRMDAMFPPDREDILGIWRRHEARWN